MLNVDRETNIDPLSIDELVVCECEVALFLGIYQGLVTENVQTCYGVVVPYLIICYKTLLK